MNPMNRRMFRDPMAARQASGILASSPQLANVVQQRQPVRMQTGGNVDTKMIQAIQQLAANGQTGTLNQIAADTRNSRAVRSAAANALVGAQKASTSIPLASSDETRMAVNRGNLASLRSKAAPQISGPILDSDMSAGNGPRPSVDGRKNLLRPDQIRNVLFPGSAQERQDKIASDTGENIDFSPATSPSSFIPDIPDGPPSGIASTSVASNVLDDSMDNAVGPASNVVSRATAGAGEQLSNLAAYTTPDESGAGEGTLSSSTSGQATAKTPVAKVIAPSALTDTDKTVPDIASNNKGIVDTTDIKLNMTTDESALSTSGADADVSASATKPAEKEKPITAEELIAAAGSLIKSESEENQAEQNDANLGITGTEKERIEQRLALMKDVLGESDDLRNDASYNAMMFGLALASGTSGDFKTDLANAGKQILASRGAASAEERKNNRAVATSAISTVLAEQDKEATRKAERENLHLSLGSAEKRALLTSGTQLEIADMGIRAKDRQLAKQITSAEGIAKFKASNDMKLAMSQMDFKSRLVAATSLADFEKAKLSANVQIAIADAQAENLANRLDKQIELETKKMGQDSAEVRRLKYLKDNPDMVDMIVDIAKKSKGNTNSFNEQLALKMAGNDSLAMMEGGVAGLVGVLKAIGSDSAVNTPENTNTLGVSQTFNVSDLPQDTQDMISGYKDGDTIPTKQGNFTLRDGRLIPQGK
jgi:hypothetical protein